MRGWSKVVPWVALALAACGGDGGGETAAPGADVALDGGSDAALADIVDQEVTGDAGPADGAGDAASAVDGVDASSCGTGQCVSPWTEKCLDEASYTVCSPAPGSCLVWSPSIACSGPCVAGSCADACTVPRAVILVDRSSSMTGLLWDRTVAAIGGFAAEHPTGVELGVRVFPAAGASCKAGAPVAPAEGTASAIVAALVPPTASPSTPLAAALEGLDDVLGPPQDATLVLILLAGTETCDDENAVRQAVQGLRGRGVTVHGIGIGDAVDEHLLGVIAAAGGQAIQNAVTAADISGAMLSALVDAGACCVDADGDGRGSFCEGGPDCNDGDGGLWAPSCAGRACGEDGCGGSCGTCAPPANGTASCVEGACVAACNPTTHDCDGECVSDADPATCGVACEPCPAVTGGAATCDGLACGIACDVGGHPCEGACVPDDSVTACGEACVSCPTDPNGVTACVDGGCTLSCSGGFLSCEGVCAVCPGGAGVAETGCAGASCVATACSGGFLPCEEGCCDRLTIDVAPSGGDPNDGGSLSLVVDPFAVAHIGWADRKSPFVGDVRYASGTWQGFTSETVASGPYGVFGRPVRLVLDAQGRPVLAWRAGTTAGSPLLMLSRREVDGFGPPIQMADTKGAWPYGASDFALVSPKAGSPTVVYPSISRLSLAWWNGVVVTQGTIADAVGATYTHAPAVLGAPDGLLDVLHAEQVGDAWGVVHAHGIASGWTAEPVPVTLSPEGGSRMSLARAADGSLGLCAFTSAGLILATQGEGGWSAETVDADGRQACALAYGPDGVPHLVYRTLYGAVRHAVGPTWATEQLGEPTGSPEQGLRWPSMGLDPKGGLHAAWWDQTAGVIRYIHVPVPQITEP